MAVVGGNGWRRTWSERGGNGTDFRWGVGAKGHGVGGDWSTRTRGGVESGGSGDVGMEASAQGGLDAEARGRG